MKTLEKTRPCRLVRCIVPNIRVRPIYWTYANVCKRTRMIRDIRLPFFFKFFGFFLIFFGVFFWVFFLGVFFGGFFLMRAALTRVESEQ